MKSLRAMQSKFCYGEYKYDYHLFLENRKSFSLVVYPNQRIALKAPLESCESEIESFLVRRWVWLENTLKEFEKYKKSKYSKRYLSGESIYYLGRQYILFINTGSDDKVKISGNKIIVSTKKSSNNSEHNRQIIDKWLDDRRNVVYGQQLIKVWKDFGYEKIPQIKIREMRKRWGSCSKDNNTITLNARLIETPTEAIRYVCVHELSHIKHRDHNKGFYRLMESHLPTNWRNIKNDLEIRFG